VCGIACSHARFRIRLVSSMDVAGISGDNADAYMHNPITGITDKPACLSIVLLDIITAGYIRCACCRHFCVSTHCLKNVVSNFCGNFIRC